MVVDVVVVSSGGAEVVGGGALSGGVLVVRVGLDALCVYFVRCAACCDGRLWMDNGRPGCPGFVFTIVDPSNII